MFIGGGSLSTAGGIKVGTFIIVVISVISFLRREDEIRLFNHSISEKTTFKALAVCVLCRSGHDRFYEFTYSRTRSFFRFAV